MSWQQRFIEVVNTQKRTEVTPFNTLISSYGNVRSQLDDVTKENIKLKQSLASVTAEGESMRSELQTVHMAVKGITIKSGRERELEETNTGLHDQIRSALKQMQEFLELKEAHQKLEVEHKDVALAKLKLEDDLKNTTIALKDREGVVGILKKEVAAYQDENATQRETFKAAKDENQRLLPMVMECKQKEAELMSTIFDLEAQIAQLNRDGVEAEGGGDGSSPKSGHHQDPNRDRVFVDDAGSAMNFVSHVTKPTYKAWETSDCHDGDVYAAVVSENGRMVWTGSTDRSIRCWDTTSGTLVNRVSVAGSVLCLDSVADTLAVGCADAVCRIYDLATLRMRHQLTGHQEKVTASYLSNDALHAYTASSDRSLKSWDLIRGSLIATSLCFSAVNDLAVSNDRICSAHYDTTLRLWDTRTGKQSGDFSKVHSKPVTCVRFTSDGNKVVSLSRDNTIKQFDTRMNTELFTLQTPDGKLSISSNMTRFTLSPDDRYIAVGSSTSGNILTWDLKSATVQGGANSVNSSLVELKSGHSSGVPVVCWSPDGKCVVSVGADKKLIGWR